MLVQKPLVQWKQRVRSTSRDTKERGMPTPCALTIKLEVVVHDEAAGQAEGQVVIVLQRLEHRVIQVLCGANQTKHDNRAGVADDLLAYKDEHLPDWPTRGPNRLPVRCGKDKKTPTTAKKIIIRQELTFCVVRGKNPVVKS